MEGGHGARDSPLIVSLFNVYKCSNNGYWDSILSRTLEKGPDGDYTVDCDACRRGEGLGVKGVVSYTRNSRDLRTVRYLETPEVRPGCSQKVDTRDTGDD